MHEDLTWGVIARGWQALGMQTRPGMLFLTKAQTTIDV